LGGCLKSRWIGWDKRVTQERWIFVSRAQSISAAAVSDAKKLNLPLEMDAAVARMKLGASDQFG